MTVHSLDGKSWLTKLERIGKLARENREIKFNNLGHTIDIDLLWNTYNEMDGKKAVGIDGVSKSQYGKNVYGKLKNLVQRIRKGSYKPKPSRITEIPFLAFYKQIIMDLADRNVDNLKQTFNRSFTKYFVFCFVNNSNILCIPFGKNTV